MCSAASGRAQHHTRSAAACRSRRTHNNAKPPSPSTPVANSIKALVESYQGETSPTSGLFHGAGRAVFKSGAVYEGTFERGLMHGAAGRLTFPDGVEWSGSMAGGAIEGSGTYRWPVAGGGVAEYSGAVGRGGLRHGLGTLTLAGGAVEYAGEWRLGKRHGRGLLQVNSSAAAATEGLGTSSQQQQQQYDGDFENDERHGVGEMAWASGATYSGGVVRGERSGRGEMVWPALGQRLVGEWARGAPCGLGEHTWEQPEGAAGGAGSRATCVMPNRYRGTFLAGRRHGEGAMLYASGARFEGCWVDGKKEGHGVYVFEDGSALEAVWRDDRPVDGSGVCHWGSEGAPPALPDGEEAEPVATAAAGAMAATAGGEGGVAAAAGSATAAAQGAASKAKGKGGSRSASAAGAAGSSAAAAAPKQLKDGGKNAAAAQKPASAGARAASASSVAAPTAAAEAPSSAAAAAAATNGAASPAQAQQVLSPLPPPPPRGFGPRVARLQLFIDDLLAADPAPAATARAVGDVLQGAAAELRSLYGRYCRCASPLVAPAGSGAMQQRARAGSGLLLAQFYELCRASGLVSRHAPLRAVGAAAAAARAPPPAVAARRARVLAQGVASGAAAAVLCDPLGVWPAYDASGRLLPGAATCVHEPLAELPYREFAEALVRVAALRYPAQPGLARRVHLLLQAHLAPLLAAGGAAGSSSGGSGSGGAAGRAGGLSVAAAHAPPTFEQQLAGEEVVSLLRARAGPLRRAFAAIVASDDGACDDDYDDDDDTEHDAGGGKEDDGGLDPERVAKARHATARAVLEALAAAGVLSQHKLATPAVAAALLETHLGAKDAEGPRIRLDCGGGDSEPPAPDEVEAAAAAAAGWRAREVAAWLGLPLAFPEFLWALARVAALLPPPPPPAAAGPAHSSRPRSTLGPGSGSGGGGPGGGVRSPIAHSASRSSVASRAAGGGGSGSRAGSAVNRPGSPRGSGAAAAHAAAGGSPIAAASSNANLAAALQRLLDGPTGLLAKLAPAEVAAGEQRGGGGGGTDGDVVE